MDGQLFGQVGKTVGGVAISEAQFGSLVDDVIRALDLQESDTVLDLCCGNGLITRELASRCRSVVGVDFSEPLISQALKHNSVENTEYIHLDVRQLGTLQERFPGRFSKILMYEAMAFLSPNDLSQLFDDLSTLSCPNVRILLASILDAERRWNFFNTWQRKWNYVMNILLLGRDPGIGRWWSRRTIERIAKDAGLCCLFINQNDSLHTAHYRIDAVFCRDEPAQIPDD